MRNLIWAFLAFTAIAAVLNPHRGLDPEQAAPKAEPSLAATAMMTRNTRGSGDYTVLERDGSGQFHVTAQVNGQDTRFLVDTGADVVALTLDTAQRLGLDVNPDTFVPLSKTASGTGYGAMVTLDRIEVAGQEFDDVQALVLDGLGTDLLGQNVLRRMGKVELQGDKMVFNR